jgi:aldose sugar dehydrogenase
MNHTLLAALSPLALFAASCAPTAAGESSGPASAEVEDAFKITALATFKEPWAMAFAPGTSLLFITEKAGTAKIKDLKNGRLGTLTGLPKVDYGGQGGLGDVAFLPSEASPTFQDRTIFLTWAEAGSGETRGAALGRGTVKCWVADECEVTGLEVIWRQTPKVSGRGHYAHRIAFSPDGKYLFVSSGERQKMQPAQDPASDLGKIIRIPIDVAGKPTGPAERYSLGHRNMLGLKFDVQGRLWDLEHGPAGGDELNLVKPGQNYGWPLVSDGDHYDGRAIPRHRTRPDLAAPAISWNPVIAPGDFLFYSGKLWPEWKGQALIAALGTGGLVRVRMDGERAIEEARYPLGNRIRSIIEAENGALLVLEDGPEGRLLHLTNK